MNELISIIVPVYNDKDYLHRCINSVLKQTYSNFELILVVDGATDGSLEICKNFQKKDSRIIVHYKNNEGTAMARNKGIELAKGDYVTFIDTDDYVSPLFLETLIKGIITTNAEISIVSLEYVNEKETNSTQNISEQEYIILDKEEAFRNLFNDDLYGNYVWNKLFKIELFKSIRFKKVKKIEDLAVMYLIFDKAKKICFNSSKLYFYVQRNSSQLHKKSFDIFETKLTVMSERFEYIKERYPNIMENYVDYAKAILECYPYIYLKKELRLKCKKDMSYLIPLIYNVFTKKDLFKLKLFGMR